MNMGDAVEVGMAGGGRGMRAIGAVLAMLAHPSMVEPARAEPVSARAFDCVIEPEQVVKLASQATGLLTRLDVDRGDLVRAGQVVGTLADEVEQAALALARARATNEHDIAAAQARLAWLQKKYGRANQLVTGNYVARATSDEAEAEMKVAENQLRLAVLNLEVARLEVRQAEAALQQRALVSPVDGIVMERMLKPGEYRNDQSPVLMVAQVDPLRVEVFVPAAFHGQIAVGAVAEVVPETPMQGSHKAVTTVVDRVMDAASGTFGVRLRLANPGLALPAGIRCTVRFPDPVVR